MSLSKPFPVRHDFQPTRWSIVQRVRSGVESVSRAALEDLCRDYWQPLFSMALQEGLPREDAEDATQDFFCTVLNKELFAQADRERGLLRTFLRKCFANHLVSRHRRGMAAVRGGGVNHVSIDAEEGYRLHRLEIPVTDTPAKAFDRSWTLTLLAHALETVHAEWVRGGHGAAFAVLVPFLDTERTADTSYGEAARALGLTRAATRQAAFRLRQEFRETFLQILSQTLPHATPEAVQAELEALMGALD